MGCLFNLVKIVIGIIMLLIMIVAGYKLIFDPYSPEPPNSCWSHKTNAEESYAPNVVEPQHGNYDFRTNVPVQVGEKHDYIMANTFQAPGVAMELTQTLENGLVYVIKVFKTQLGEDFTPTIISAHDSFDKHDRWSEHKTGRAVDIRMNDLPYYKKRLVVKILEKTLPKEYKVEWQHQGTVNEKLHFQSHK